MMRYFLCLGILAAAVLVDGQPAAFVSIDCGFSGDQAYNDKDTNLTYQPDAEFIGTGSNHELGETYLTDKPTQAHNLRSFPDGTRNCYTIKNVIRGYKYLIRASFLYGNYDNDSPPTDNGELTFDLYLGASLWKTMRIIDADQLYIAEIITLASSDSFLICLLRTGDGIPFISALELRPIGNGIYHDVNQTVSLLLWERWGMSSVQTVRYPDDIYDRKWMPAPPIDCINAFSCKRDFGPNSNVVATRKLVQVDLNDPYEVPSEVMQTARTPPDTITLKLDFYDGNIGSPPPLLYIYLHFSELLMPNTSDSRVFQIEIPGVKPIPYYMTSDYLVERHIRMVYQADTDPSTYYLNLTKMPESTLPPMINAMEVYSEINLANITTDVGDVDAMMTIKRQYNMHNLQGSPCSPAQLTWSIVNCSFSSSAPSRVTSLNLSHKSLGGPISTAIANLTALKFLNLSNNYFIETIPDFLANLSSLQSLDLSYNKLDGPTPADLCHKQAKDLLWLRLDNNPCSSGGACDCSKHTNRIQVLVISMAVTVVVVLILLSVFFLWRRRGKRQPSKPQLKWRQIGGSSFHTDNSRFTYQDLRLITNNFERAIGKGGFGTVYYGRLPDGTEVAVKMQKRLLAIDQGITEELKNDELSSYSHAIKEFQVEAQLLSRVHHRNLVSLIGYCNEGYSLGLVFEYAAQGSLRDHLSEKASSEKNLSWRERLRIAIDAAQGLEYLHKSCKPPIIHRDVKTSNILLSENFEAKIADFGLSKSFVSDAQTHISTHAIAGTPGYVDPEYHNTFRFNEKSDVYGFGIVLLELVTGLPAVLKFPDTGHILQWVRQGLARGNVADIVDLRLKCRYDIYSVKKIIDLALHCTSMDVNERPTMTVVSILLKESLQLELARGEPEFSMNSSTEILLDVSRSGTSEITSSAPEMSGPSAR